MKAVADDNFFISPLRTGYHQKVLHPVRVTPDIAKLNLKIPECTNHLFYKMTYKWIFSPLLFHPTPKTTFYSHLLHRHTLRQPSATAQLGPIAHKRSRPTTLCYNTVIACLACVRKKGYAKEAQGILDRITWGDHMKKYLKICLILKDFTNSR